MLLRREEFQTGLEDVLIVVRPGFVEGNDDTMAGTKSIRNR